ncbi:MAG: DUF4407 domain-containing protein [Saprospiraceae bacterium]|nr:DUF4407 domain-containing protein [Bacteroidia bacterium]NNE16192.1 DUF4407 domain-containing protein [Saprospiraceae bacterium]NNL92385.1 DUF4407 domain-containing protein [Saprospiraceae bacterium]
MQAIQNFFLVCSGVNNSILKRTPTEINRYTGIGATIFFTGIFAAVAGGYALYTVFDSYTIATFFGLLWGLMIFNLDRYIVSTMKKQGRFFRDFATAFPRLMLALLIAVVIAKPLELKIFESEIQSEIAVMQQENLIEQEALVKSRFSENITILKSEITSLKQEIEDKALLRDNLANEALMEADGTGGSMQRNLGPIYAAKKQAADNMQAELNALTIKNNALIAQKNEQLGDYENQSATALTELKQLPLNGLAARLEAHSRLMQKSSAILLASIFIIILFIAIETAPIFVKLISRRGPYDFVLDKHEHAFLMNHKLRTTLLANSTNNNISFETETMDYKTQVAIAAEKEISKKALQDHLEAIKDQPLIWKDLLRKGKLFQLD